MSGPELGGQTGEKGGQAGEKESLSGLLFNEVLPLTSGATIYGLTDPFAGRLHYVGRTTLRLALRVHQHWIGRDHFLTHAYPISIWLRELEAAGEQPGTCVIASVPIGLAKDAEAYWIAYYRRQGAPLLNQITVGGRPHLYCEWYKHHYKTDPCSQYDGPI